MSQEFSEGPIFRSGPGGVVIAYDYELPDGSYAWAEMRFSGVVAFRFTADEQCTREEFAAYDKLMAVERSAWLAGVERIPTGTRHLRIYFDEIGCYEVLAGEFIAPELPEAPSLTEPGAVPIRYNPPT